MRTYWSIAAILALCMPLALAETPALAPAPVATLSDPSLLTTQLTQREISSLKELVFARFAALVERMDAVDKAISLQHADLTRVPTDVDKQVGNLKELAFQKVAALEIATALQLRERDERVNQIAGLNNVALQAALSAAKEAVAAQQTNTARQLDQLYVNFKTISEGNANQLNDLKTQLATFDGRSRGIGDSWGVILGSIGAAGVVFGIFMAFNRRTEVVAPVTPPAGTMVVPAGYVLVPTNQTKAT